MTIYCLFLLQHMYMQHYSLNIFFFFRQLLVMMAIYTYAYDGIDCLTHSTSELQKDPLHGNVLPLNT